MKTRRPRLFALLACLSMLFVNQVQAQETDALQSLIDRVAAMPVTRAAGTVTDIDLSPYTQPRTVPLYVRNGINVRFINGTLTRAKSFTDGPLIAIQADSRLELSSTCTLSSNNVDTQYPVVDIENGELTIEGGKICDVYGWEDVTPSSKGKTAVELSGGTDARYYQTSGETLGRIENSNGGWITLKGGTVYRISTSSDFKLSGDVFIKANVYFYSENAKIILVGSLLNKVRLSNYKVNQKVLTGGELYTSSGGVVDHIMYLVSNNDVEKLELGGNGDNYTLSLENNAVYVREKQTDPNLIYNEQQLRTRLKEIADNNESSVSKPVKLTIASAGFTISSSVFINGCYVEITGGRLTISKNTSHSPFMISENSGLNLNNIEIDFNEFNSYARGFDNNGGYLTIGSGTKFLNAVSTEWYRIPFYYLYAGTTTISPTNKNVANEVFSIYFSNFVHNAQVLFTSSPGYALITGKWDEYDSEEPYTLIKGSGYTLKEADFNNIRFENLPDDLEVYYDKSDNTVKLHKKKDPNYIESEDDLQKRLDEIAAEKPTEPVILTIREEGITLTKGIYAEEGCKAVITGGKITAASSVANSDYAFYISQAADIRFKDITLDLSASWPDYKEHFINNGTLTLDNTEIIAEKLRIYGECRIYGYTHLPMLHLSGWGKPAIKLLSKMEDTWIIESDWEKFNVEEAPYTIVSGDNYTVTKEDYSKMQFVNLPDDMEAAYNDELKVVQIQKKEKECDLQSLIDGLCDLPDDCDAPSCREIPVPEDGVDIGCADAVDPLQCAVDKVLDGGDDSVDDQGVPRRVICMCAPAPHLYFDIPSIRVNPYSTLTIRNYRFKSEKYEHQYIRVYGTLIIDVNVYIYRFIRFIHIMKGGRVIWRGGHVEDVDEIVHNEGGTLEIEGDFDNGGKRFVNPEGCTLIIRKGTFKGDIENHGTLIIEGGKVEGKVENHHEFRMEGGTVSKEIWSETDIWIKGGVQVTDIHIKRGCRIHVIGKLTITWRIHFFVIDEFDVYVPFVIGDDGYRLTKEDFECLHIELPDGYRWIYYDGIIVIVRIVYNVVTIEEYLEYFGPQGTPENPWSIDYDKTNIDIETDWHIKKDYHLIFDEGQFSMTGGNIYIEEGASLWLKNIKFKGEGYHIYVYGTLYIDEGVDFDNIKRFIHLCKGGQIRFVTQPTYIVNIYISEEHIVTYKPVITDIREEWLQYINIELPDGYRWIFVDGTIVIIRIPYNVTTIEELLAYFGPKGTEDTPWSFVYNTTNIDIEIDWHVQKDYYLIFDGGQFSMPDGDIYIDEGASLWLKNIRFTGKRHIYVNGVLVIDENVDFGDIAEFVHLMKGGKIIVKKRLTSKLYMVVGEVTHGEVLAINGLAESDIARLDILLPDGYTWEYHADDGTIIVKELPVTVTAESYTRAYGEENPSFEYTSAGVALKGQPEISCEATASSPVGTYPIIIKKGGVTNQNDSYVNGTLTITKAPLTIKAGMYTRKQGDENPEFVLKYEGFKNGETEDVLTKQPVVTCEANESSAPGEYAVTLSGAEAQNYEIGYVDGKLIVMDADAIVIMAKSYTREYGEENPTFEFSTEGAALDGEPVIECEATVTSAVGTYDIVVKKGSVKNYNDTYVKGTLTITKAPLKVTVKDVEREQGQENPQFEVVYEGWKLQDTESVLTKKPVATTTATKDSPVGEYAITVSGGEAENYELTYQSGKLTVTVPSGIAELMKSGRPFDVYDVKGRKVRRQVTTLKGLKKGVYIIDGKKVVVR